MKKLVLFVLMWLIACSDRQEASVSQSIQTGCSVSSISASNAAPNGGSLITCKDGTSSLILNGSIMKPVQFCANSIPSYPTTFPEIGFCIDNNLYAVYSANGGFLVLVTPGTYSSNGINSSCTFTVLSGCVIQ